jgi:hypothetical protein
VAISQQERAFFIAFGERLAALRKAQGLTQVQLAGALDVSQQAITTKAASAACRFPACRSWPARSASALKR